MKSYTSRRLFDVKDKIKKKVRMLILQSRFPISNLTYQKTFTKEAISDIYI
jgi:hypothetical protein